MTLLGDRIELVGMCFNIPTEDQYTSLWLFRTNYYILEEHIKESPELLEDVRKEYPLKSMSQEEMDAFDKRFPERGGFSKSMPILVFAKPVCWGKYQYTPFSKLEEETDLVMDKEITPHPSLKENRWYKDEVTAWIGADDKHFMTHGSLGFRLWEVIDIMPALRPVDSKSAIKEK